MNVNKTIELPWPSPTNPNQDPLAGQTLQDFNLPTGSITPFHFRTPAVLGAKQGSITVSTAVPSVWSAALNFTAGDISTNIAGPDEPPTVMGGMQPRVQWRGVATAKGQTPMLQLKPNTDYYWNLAPNPAPGSVSGRNQLDAGRSK